MQARPEAEAIRPSRRIPSKDELPLGHARTPSEPAPAHDRTARHGPEQDEPDEWVRMTPNHLRNIVEDVVKRSSDRKPVFRVGAPHPSQNADEPGPRPGQTLAEWFRESGGDPDEASRLRRHPAAQRTSTPDETRTEVVPDLIEELLADVGTNADADADADDDGLNNVPNATSFGTGPEGQTRPARDPPHHDHVNVGADTTAPPRPSNAPASAVARDDPPQRLRPATEILARPKMPPVDESLLPENTAGVDDLDEDEYRRLPPNTASVEEIQSAPVGGEEVSKWHEGVPPETIAIHDEGAYELNVKRLLEKNPIVVHKDGTYSLHLPSLMEMAGGKRRR